MAVGPGAQGCAAAPLPTHGPTLVGEEGVSQGNGGRGDSSWEVLILSCSCGSVLCFSTARRPAMGRAAPNTLRSAALSCRLVMGTSSEISACRSCCRAGWLEHTSEWRKQKQRSLLLLKQASNKQLHVPNIGQLNKNPETFRFPKSFCSLLFNSSHTIPKSYSNCLGSHLQTSPHSPHPSPVPPAPGAASYSPPCFPSPPWDLQGSPHCIPPLPSPSTTGGCLWGAVGRAGTSSSSPGVHSMAAPLLEKWWLPWRWQLPVGSARQEQSQSWAAAAMTGGDGGPEDQEDYREVSSREAGAGGGTEHLEV